MKHIFPHSLKSRIMKKISWLLIVLSVWMISCQKDDDNKVMPTEIGWEASQKVRINRVEMIPKVGQFFWSLPVDDSIITVEYKYDGLNSLKKINLYRSVYNPETNREFVISNNNLDREIISNNKNICLLTGYPAGYDLSSNELIYDGKRIEKIQGEFNFCTFGNPSADFLSRTADFKYKDNGLLEKINSNIRFTDKKNSRIGYEVNDIIYDISNKIVKFKKNNYFSLESDNNNKAESLAFSVDYVPASDIPDDLKRRVNQSLMDFNAFGLNEHFFNLANQSGFLTLDNYPYRFSDWIVVFGNERYQSIPANGIRLISSFKVVGIRESPEDNNVQIEIDTTFTFPYTHDPVAKTLEIAGLKIWYEVVD
jgi:hypothetical protein